MSISLSKNLCFYQHTEASYGGLACCVLVKCHIVVIIAVVQQAPATLVLSGGDIHVSSWDYSARYAGTRWTVCQLVSCLSATRAIAP